MWQDAFDEGEIDHSFSRAFNVRLSGFFTRGDDLIGQLASVDLLNSGVCPPCGTPCDTLVFDKPGVCPQCGMTLGDQAAAPSLRDP